MEERLLIRSVAAHVFNRKEWIADKGRSPSLGNGHDVNSSSPYKVFLLGNIDHCVRLVMILWYNLCNGKGIRDFEHGVCGACIRQSHLQQ